MSENLNQTELNNYTKQCVWITWPHRKQLSLHQPQHWADWLMCVFQCNYFILTWLPYIRSQYQLCMLFQSCINTLLWWVYVNNILYLNPAVSFPTLQQCDNDNEKENNKMATSGQLLQCVIFVWTDTRSLVVSCYRNRHMAHGCTVIYCWRSASGLCKSLCSRSSTGHVLGHVILAPMII